MDNNKSPFFVDRTHDPEIAAIRPLIAKIQQGDTLTYDECAKACGVTLEKFRNLLIRGLRPRLVKEFQRITGYVAYAIPSVGYVAATDAMLAEDMGHREKRAKTSLRLRVWEYTKIDPTRLTSDVSRAAVDRAQRRTVEALASMKASAKEVREIYRGSCPDTLPRLGSPKNEPPNGAGHGDG